eukprot:10697441-Alexandrium_andersonii.AAC.1
MPARAATVSTNSHFTVSTCSHCQLEQPHYQPPSALCHTIYRQLELPTPTLPGNQRMHCHSGMSLLSSSTRSLSYCAAAPFGPPRLSPPACRCAVPSSFTHSLSYGAPFGPPRLSPP